jgi:ketosteroid isomerase-like protein
MTPPPASDTQSVIDAFGEAFERHDVDAIMQLMTEDCVFDNTEPAPDGKSYVGQAEVRGYWERFFSRTPTARFVTEDAFVAGDRALIRWVFHWGSGADAGHVRGVDVMKVRDGKVAEKLSYVKG